MLSKLKNFLSRKFLLALASVIAGIIVIYNGGLKEGVVLILTSLFGYLIAEGYLDSQSIKSSISTVSEIAEVIDSATPEDTLVDDIADTIKEIGDNVHDNIN